MDKWSARDAAKEFGEIFQGGIDLFRSAILAPSLQGGEYEALDGDEPVKLEWTLDEHCQGLSDALHLRYREWLAKSVQLAFRYQPSVGSEFLGLLTIMESYVTLNRFASPVKGRYEDLVRADKNSFVNIYIQEWEVLRDRHLLALDQLRRVEDLVLERIEERRSMLVQPIFSGRVDQAIVNRAFVLMPFSEPWSNRIYRVISEVFREMGLSVARADELTGMDVLEDIWYGILSAQYVIADLTARNPNVFYELGLAHVVGKRVIMITQSVGDVPFDVRRFRFIEYQDNMDGYDALRRGLVRYISGEGR